MSYANRAIAKLQQHGYEVEVSFEPYASTNPKLLPRGYKTDEGIDNETALIITLPLGEMIPEPLLIPLETKHVLITAKIEGVPEDLENGGSVFIYPDGSFDFTDNPTGEMYKFLLEAGYVIKEPETSKSSSVSGGGGGTGKPPSNATSNGR